MKITQSFEGRGSPLISFKLRGPLQPPTDFEFTGILDTGFTGFIAMPIIKAFPVGLLLRGVMTSTLADGKSQSNLYCLGQVVLESEGESKTQIGSIILNMGDSDILVGMEFLRKFLLTMIVNPTNNILTLVDSVGLKPLIEE